MMVVLKCKCGCFFSVRKTVMNRGGDELVFACQNCGNSLKFKKGCELFNLSPDLERAGFTAHVIPDDAQIGIRFSL